MFSKRIYTLNIQGVGKDVHCFSDYLVKMRIFDANGELRTYSADEEGGDVFKAVSAGFGCFGVVYDITIQVRYFCYKDKVIDKRTSLSFLFISYIVNIHCVDKLYKFIL